RMEVEARLVYRCNLPAGLEHGTYFAPVAFELASLEHLPGEVFGPVLHVLCYDAGKRDTLLDAVNARGYGLTFGIHTGLDSPTAAVLHRGWDGAVCVNRSTIGAVVGVHAFGGMARSGTGPEAGGPDYLRRFTVEKPLSFNTAAAGGNASLLTLGED